MTPEMIELREGIEASLSEYAIEFTRRGEDTEITSYDRYGGQGKSLPLPIRCSYGQQYVRFSIYQKYPLRYQVDASARLLAFLNKENMSNEFGCFLLDTTADEVVFAQSIPNEAVELIFLYRLFDGLCEKFIELIDAVDRKLGGFAFQHVTNKSIHIHT